jgi:WD40 repeat protein
MKSHLIGNGVKRLLIAGFLLGPLFGLPAITTAQVSEPPREPILRIETGMHTSTVRDMAVDSGEKFLVTASGDKTARVWDLGTGRLLKTLRPPIGSGFEGKLDGIAISANGDLVSVAGFTGTQWDKRAYIYLFERSTGHLARRLVGPTVEYSNEGFGSMRFSPDGALLAAGLINSGQVYLFRVADGAIVARDTSYEKESTLELDYSPSGDLVVTSVTNEATFVRLYAQDLRLRIKTQLARDVRRARFSPDGKKIAMVSDQTSNLYMLSGEDLSVEYSVTLPKLDYGATVEWSRDGKTLYVGTKYGAIIRWDGQGKGHKDLFAQLGDHFINRLVSLANGELAFAYEEKWGVLLASGQIKFLQSSQIRYDFRDGEVNSTGEVIGFRYDKIDSSLATFNITGRALTRNASSKVGSGAEAQSGLYLVGGSWLTLWKGIRSSGPPINESNTKLWRVEVPDTIGFLSFSGNGKVIVASLKDGTIRWYRVADGKELLAFFPHADRKRWVLWTPSGYYDASPGAEDLIGWHVNNGKDQAADFFPVGQFRSTYYRPDVIARILQTGDERVALQQANEAAGRKQQESTVAQQLPPVVEIMSPSDSSEVSATEVAVRFRVRTPSGEPVTSVKALVDGRPMGARQLVREAAASNVDGMRELRVTVPERDSEIAIIAENRFTSSVPASVRVKWHSATAARPEAFVVKPKLYILAVGVSQYADGKFNLKLADKDAGDFVKVMMAQKDLLYRDVVVKLLTNEKATKDDVLDGLDWIRQETTSNDVAMVFFAGHGVNDQNNYYYFCPYNVDPSRLLRTGVAFSDIKKTVSAIAGKALFFVDSCHSGNAIGLAARRGPLDINIVINELSSAENGVVVFSASTGSESSYEREEWNNGAFTKALVEGLSGAASIGNTGRITYNMLNVYISERVKELTKGQQHPTMISPQTVPDFPIAVKK